MLDKNTFEGLKRSIILRQLEELGTTRYLNQSIYELDYQTLKYVLTMSKIQIS